MEHVTLVDLRWLVKFGDGVVLPERRGVITAWQELPSEAHAEMSALKRYTGHNLPIVVVSYPWLSKGHPDPHGYHLSALLPAFKALVKLCDENGPGSTFGVLWDFLSLPQRGYTSGYNTQLDDRTAEQLARFSAGLRTINYWYGHPYTTVILLNVPPPITAETQTPYEKRGWCLFERRLSSISKPTTCLIELREENLSLTSDDWVRYQAQCASNRLAPMDPETFTLTLTSGLASGEIRFTNGKDLHEVVLPQYRQGFVRLFSQSERLDYFELGWGDEDAELLAKSLRYAAAPHPPQAPMGATQKLTAINLNGNKLGLPGLSHLAAVLRESADVLPNLQWLHLSRNSLGNGVSCLADAARAGGMQKLRMLDLRQNALGEDTEAAIDLVTAVLTHLTNLERLWLDANGLTDAFALGAAAALASCNPLGLQVLDLPENAISDVGIEALAKQIAQGSAPGLDWTQGLNLEGNPKASDRAILELLSSIQVGYANPTAKYLQGQERLEYTDLGWNDEIAQQWSGAVVRASHDVKTSTSALTHLKLDQNLITAHGLGELATAFAHGALPTLTSLTLNHNRLAVHSAESAGLRGLSQAIWPLRRERPTRVDCLELSGNKLSAEHARQLLNPLMSRIVESIRFLDLSRNRLKDAGGKAVADAIIAASCGAAALEVLDLSANQLTDSSAKKLAALFHDRSATHADELRVPRLLTLRLDLNHITSKGTQALCEALERAARVGSAPKQLEAITLDGNQLDHTSESVVKLANAQATIGQAKLSKGLEHAKGKTSITTSLSARLSTKESSPGSNRLSSRLGSGVRQGRVASDATEAVLSL